MITWKVYRDEAGKPRMWWTGYRNDWTSQPTAAAGWADRRDAARVAVEFAGEEQRDYDGGKWAFGEAIVGEAEADATQIVPGQDRFLTTYTGGRN